MRGATLTRDVLNDLPIKRRPGDLVRVVVGGLASDCVCRQYLLAHEPRYQSTHSQVVLFRRPITIDGLEMGLFYLSVVADQHLRARSINIASLENQPPWWLSEDSSVEAQTYS